MPEFSHLHCHTQYSLLDGAASIGGLMKKAQADGMKAVAMTDHGNMFGAFNFVAEANKYNVKPIVGCEFYLVNDRHQKVFTKEQRDNRCYQCFADRGVEFRCSNLRRINQATKVKFFPPLLRFSTEWPEVLRPRCSNW